ncbi:MAG: hypothetical protein DI628_00950 [Blastochloris viridis]|uniref:Uncharacterized protein n=1 Tax=Blastochloris viridis TaxID=1079 RepID=A0A6N4RBW0_BLAVI|nr:MAG: hypothetical protein DI628_00950 [Blastochloris viridis]
MRFFTQVACFAVHHCKPGLLLTMLAVGGKNLVAADLLVAAVNSRHPAEMWGTLKDILKADLSDPSCVGAALPGIAVSNYLPAFSQMMDTVQRLQMTVDTDDLLVLMARQGADACWTYAVSELKLVPAPVAYDALVDAAILGGNALILDSLERAVYLPQEFRTRIFWKRKLDDVVRGRNPNYIRDVVCRSEWLKPEDFDTARTFAMRGKHDYLKESVIDYAIDMATGTWMNYLTTRPVEAPKRNVHELKLKTAA